VDIVDGFWGKYEDVCGDGCAVCRVCFGVGEEQDEPLSRTLLHIVQDVAVAGFYFDQDGLTVLGGVEGLRVFCCRGGIPR
jgi:hypothetical protein